jgi:hypothetical protein
MKALNFKDEEKKEWEDFQVKANQTSYKAGKLNINESHNDQPLKASSSKCRMWQWFV